MAADIGKVFEGEMTEVFKQLKAQYLVGWHRLTDTGAAGSVVSAQPSDYILGLPPGAETGLDGQRMMFLEIKASEVHHKLAKAMVRPSQRGAIGTFRYMLGIPYFILFWDTQLGVLQLWDGIAIQGEKNIDKRHMLAQWEGIGCINKLITQRVVDHLVAYFHIPRSAVTLEKVRQSAH
jgi:hypothetical protein